MNPLCDLPLGLLALSLAIFGLANAISDDNAGPRINATSPFDPFEQLRLRATQKPSDPVCCLIPLSSEPLPTTAEFISFEEWKSKQLELQAQAQAADQTPSPDTPAPEAPPGSSHVASLVSGETDPSMPSIVEPVSPTSPHFRVPLTDRFNYASLDCSARVHTSHHSARSPSAILSSKKDRYMLSPCSANPNFVVVELCDDIRIDTVQLANFEFFSGVFRDFRVSVAQTYTTDGQGWIEAGTYRAKNIRGVQSFHPLVELRPFYRYLRLDFLTHYGGEFYCPISLLRVYGLTQMEEWKWEVWQRASEGLKVPSEVGDTDKVGNETILESSTTLNGTTLEGNRTIAAIEATSVSDEADHLSTSENYVTLDVEMQHPRTHQYETLSTPILETSSIKPPPTSNASVTVEPTTPLATASTTSHLPSYNNTQEIQTDTNSFPNSSVTPAIYSSITASNVSQPMSSPTSISSIQTIVPHPSPSPIPSGESIYRTIMNRLAMLETNTTLYQKYVEEQTLQVREALRRLEEDVGRLEGISKAQQQTFSKTMHELERRRRQMEEERWELLIKVNHLADEVILEKRLGIAQLCLLLTVLVFLALTRGSRTDAVSFLDGTMHRLNSFGRRSPWSSVDWTQKRWNSRSPTPTPANLAAIKQGKEARTVTISPPRGEMSDMPPVPATPPPRSQTPRSHLRRPTTPRHHDIARLGGSERPVGRLRRSNSHTTPANTLLSAKRFARSAHLHEVQLSIRRRAKASGSDDEAESGDEREADGSPRPRGKRLESRASAPLLPGPSVSPKKTPVGEGSEPESWVDTEPGSEPGIDYDDAEFDEIGGQDVEIKTKHPVPQSPIMNPHLRA